VFLSLAHVAGRGRGRCRGGVGGFGHAMPAPLFLTTSRRSANPLRRRGRAGLDRCAANPTHLHLRTWAIYLAILVGREYLTTDTSAGGDPRADHGHFWFELADSPVFRDQVGGLEVERTEGATLMAVPRGWRGGGGGRVHEQHTFVQSRRLRAGGGTVEWALEPSHVLGGGVRARCRNPQSSPLTD